MADPVRRVVSGAKPGTGHFEEFLANPARFMLRAWEECGEVAEFDLGGSTNVLLVGPAAHEAVFRAPDEQLSPSEPYAYMVPVFGEGIQFGAPVAVERQQVKMQSNALTPRLMRGYAEIVAGEVERRIADWGDAGEKDFYDEFKELVLRTSTHCLMGPEFRSKLTGEFGALFHDLEMAVSPASILDPYGQEEVFARRDAARRRLSEIITEVVRERRSGAGEHPDMLQSFLRATYTDGRPLSEDEIVGMVIWIMFAGHHTSSNTSTWTLVELARHPDHAEKIAREVEGIFAGGDELSFAALREIPRLERFLFEVLRLHPPLVTLMRLVKRDFDFRGLTIPAGETVVVSPYVAHRMPDLYPEPECFDPDRSFPDDVFAYIPFGGGRRKCVGNAFALLQVKAVFCALLQRYEFELVDPADSYREAMPSLILRTTEPCRLRYRRRS
ncbi:MAG: cytochrome P450 [Myxococcota bacterium]|nr:cytochrome P450 [Myxococcota bacterium]